MVKEKFLQNIEKSQKIMKLIAGQCPVDSICSSHYRDLQKLASARNNHFVSILGGFTWSTRPNVVKFLQMFTDNAMLR